MTLPGNVLEVKSRFGAEFRRFSITKAEYSFGSSNSSIDPFNKFYLLLQQLHLLSDQPFLIFYSARDDDVLPINNADNLAHAVSNANGLLRLQVFRKEEYTGYLSDLPQTRRHQKSRFAVGPFASSSSSSAAAPAPNRRITVLEDFRKVSSIIDVDIVPESYRRVKLMRSSSKPLGFYIRDGTSIRVTPNGIEKVPAIFISRLMQGGLAESTGLLAVNDEVIEVNGIEVTGKTLDQVTDMMVANSSNLILTTKPVNQSTCLQTNRRSRASQLSHESNSDARSYHSDSGGISRGGIGAGSYRQVQASAAAAPGVPRHHAHSGSLPTAAAYGAPDDTL
ncbi:hypothetical protein BOX15_Mlig008818g1 [Macrostomum lignano]|uniref:Partitioning defective 6 homolog gamma n=2 Tax=Macrostomum lignano TaxID=282301 RepID=A0A1I8IHM2_9PLAT|nr:hypothetical protein BOX15_Mlig008818g2 [Macrostomum lignano]PAA55588.1 hypothetical protein BOX15_Mlig016877g1 [Macrostomum lignano]PAA55865.1 hypothetical protein BOX15_Mlig008818g1 [Macrostomum lignano]